VVHEEVDPHFSTASAPGFLAESGVRVSIILFSGGESVADPKDPRPQADKFRDLARELECDEDEDAFDERLRQLAKAPPPRKDGEAES
jgi:hypothetical protein